MSTALVFLWKEYRAQRGLLAAYLALVFPSLMLGFLLAPDRFWVRDGACAHVLGWFFAAGVIGAVAFAAPQLVRGEFAATGRNDQFAQRLPGGLLPAWSGKVLFLVLVSLGLPLLGLLVGEVYLDATGVGFADLWQLRHADKAVYAAWPAVGVGALIALVLPTWIWAIGTWLPGGRMAVGATALLLTAVGAGVLSVLRFCPGLEQTIGSWHWLWPVWPAGLLVVAASWLRGRRGGGPRRSAQWGAATAAVLLLPPGAWLGARAHDYHHPDVDRLTDVRLLGVSPDGGLALMAGAGRPEWQSILVRLDLASGACERIGSTGHWAGPEVVRPYVTDYVTRHRFWRLGEAAERTQRVLDLVTGESTLVDHDRHRHEAILPDALRRRVEAAARGETVMRGPGGSAVWATAGAICFARPDGGVDRVAVPQGVSFHYRGGHGCSILGGATGGPQLFDFARRTFVELPRQAARRAWFGYALRGQWLLREGGRFSGWHRFDPDAGTFEKLRLSGEFLEVLDDDELLFGRVNGPYRSVELFAWRMVDGQRTPLATPVIKAAQSVGTVMQRDCDGAIWIRVPRHGAEPERLRLDPATRAVERLPPFPGVVRAFVPGAAIVETDDGVLRFDYERGTTTRIYPRAQP